MRNNPHNAARANRLGDNLTHAFVTGKRNVEEARVFYAESMMNFVETKKPNQYQTAR